MLKYLLDTNIVIYVIKRRPMEVMGVFNENAGRMAVSAITLSELYHGAEKSAKVAQNLAVVEEFASLLEVLPYSAKASQQHGAIRAELEKAGRPIGANDLHIAAHARSEDLTLVTNNLGEFERGTGPAAGELGGDLSLIAGVQSFERIGLKSTPTLALASQCC
jgi:tRNA(fMet)-specific endonuclease VapC